MSDERSTVVGAVVGEISGLGEDAGKSALAATALVLAAELDDVENSATSKSLCARALSETMDRLRDLAPPEKEAKPVDDLRARRAARVGGSTAKDQLGS